MNTLRYFNSSLILAVTLCGILTSNACVADNSIEIVKAEGEIEVSQHALQRGEKVRSKSLLPPRNILKTGADGRAVIRIGDSGYIVLEKNSTVETDRSGKSANIFRQVTGMIYYALNKIRGSHKPVEIRTATATLGIRGTRFIVADFPDRKEIGVRKGLISVTSTAEAFEIHRKAELDEFEAFQREASEAIDAENQEFREYQAETQKEFIEYKREFELGKGRMVSFNGRVVTESPLSNETNKEMESLESFGAEWIKNVRD